MNKNKRLRQSSLKDFIHFQKVPKFMNRNEGSSIDGAGSSEPPVDLDGSAAGIGTNSDQKLSLPSVQNEPALDSPEQTNITIETKLNHSQETTEKKKKCSQSSCELFLSESWDESLLSSEETPTTNDTLKRYTQVLPNLPILQPASDHSVLFNYNIVPGKVPLPYPEEYRDCWENSHVRLPCSPQSLYPVKNALTGTEELQRRWEIIETTLANPIRSSTDLEEAILTFNTQYASRWNFHCLHHLLGEEMEPEEVDRFFDNDLPKIVHLCLSLPKVCTQPIPLLLTNQTRKVTLSQKQVASLLANAFLCTFPRRNTQNRNSEYSTFPSVNFNTLFAVGGRANKGEKLKCLLNYFRRVTREMPTGTITFHRQSVTDFPVWKESQKSLPQLCVQSKGLIEVDGMGMLQII